MADTFESTIINRLRTLNHTQRSIEKTSRAFLKNKHMAKEIVKIWFKEFRAAADKLKIAFLHLANDVVMNGVQKAPQFAKLFEPVLPIAFRETACINSHQVRTSVAHLLVVWAGRQVYPRSFLRQLRSICQRAATHADSNNPSKIDSETSPFDFSFTSALINASALTHHQTISPSVATPSSNLLGNFTADVRESLSPRPDLSLFREEMQKDLQSQRIKPPETLELVKQLESLQDAPSANVTIRQKIAEFPPEVSDSQCASTLLSEGADPNVIIERIQSALCQLKTYNHKLDEEMLQRQNLTLSLLAYHQTLRDACQQSRRCIQDIRDKRSYADTLQSSLDGHLRSLPDDIDVGSDQKYADSVLAPLPSVGDLFR